MSRYQVLVGKHVQEEERTKMVDGKPVTRIVTCEYAAYDPKRNIVDSSKAVVASRNESGQIVAVEHRDMDLEKRFNQPGFSEKFRRLQEPEQLAQDMNNEDLMRFAKVAIAKGLITAADMGKSETSGVMHPIGSEVTEAMFKKDTVTLTPQATTAAQDPLIVASLKRDLAAVANQKTPLIGLQTIAENEEIDISGCKNDKQEWKEAEVRKVIKAALEARLK